MPGLWVLLVCLSLAGEVQAITAEQIVKEAIKSQGGQKKLESIRDLFVHLSYQTLGKERLKGEMYEFYRPPNRLATVLRSYAKPDVIKVYDGKKGRFMRGTHPRIFVMDKRDLRQMRESLSRAKLLILTNLLVKGARFELLSQKNYPMIGIVYKVRWKGPNGQVIQLSIDGRQYLLHGAIFGVGQGLKVNFGKHRVYDGVRLPTKITVYQNGKKTAKISVEKVTFNRKVDPGVFTNPRKAAALVKN